MWLINTGIRTDIMRPPVLSECELQRSMNLEPLRDEYSESVSVEYLYLSALILNLQKLVEQDIIKC